MKKSTKKTVKKAVKKPLLSKLKRVSMVSFSCGGVCSIEQYYPSEVLKNGYFIVFDGNCGIGIHYSNEGIAFGLQVDRLLKNSPFNIVGVS